VYALIVDKGGRGEEIRRTDRASCKPDPGAAPATPKGTTPAIT